MKKFLLSALAFGAVMTSFAMEPLTPEQLSKLEVNVSNYSDGSFCLSSKVGLEYTDASNPELLKINNFLGDGLSLNANIDWETGTISVVPYTFSSDYDDDTYETFLLMVVSEEAANLSSPMDPAFSTSKVYGTISESGITLENWNMVKVPASFASMTKMYDKGINTEIVPSNAEITLQLRDVDWDTEDPVTFACPIVDTDIITLRTYVKDNGDELFVYNWDDMSSCVKLYKGEADGKTTFSTKADELVYVRNARYQYGIYPFDGQTDVSLWDVEAAPLVSEPVVAKNEIDFGYWVIYALARQNDRTMGRYAKIKLDFDLDLGSSGDAVQPLTPEQLSKLEVNVSNYSDDSFCLSSKVSLEYTDASNPELLKINNFLGDGLSLNANIDWETGTISVVPYTFSSDYDDDTYETFLLMVVSEEAANLSSPMDPAFSTSKVYGTISESGITLENWNMVKVPASFASMTKMYDKGINTEIVPSNAEITLQLRGVDWDTEDPVTFACPIVDTDIITLRTYVKDNGDELFVYNWDDMSSCVKLYKDEADGKTTFSTNADELVYVRNARYQYGIYPFDGQTDVSLWDVEAAPLVSEPVVAKNEIDFGYWVIYALARQNDRTMGRYAKIKLDFDLDLDLSGIADVIVGEPVKVTYFNLSGIEVANPRGGVFVKVATYADGKTVATKVAM